MKPSAISATNKNSTKAASKVTVTAQTKDLTIKILKKHYPDAHCALIFKNPFELLIATILSAQCTDEKVNQVTKTLFVKYPTPQALANADIDELEQVVRPTGFFKNKARNIKSCAHTLVEKHQGQVPKDLDALVELAGVGRKTANVVLGNAYGIISGIVVDTHVGRLSYRLGWTKSEDPILIENDLQKFVAHEDWILISHLLIWHGRKICMARSPQCEVCPLNSKANPLCPQKGVVHKTKLR